MVTRELTKGITRGITRGIIQPFNYYIFTVKTDNAGTSLSNQFTVPTVSGGTYDETTTVDWGDGNIDTNMSTYNDARWTHTFAGGAGTYEVKIWGTFNGWNFAVGGDKNKITNISQFGIFQLFDAIDSFRACENLTITATDPLNLTGITDLSRMFFECISLTDIPSLRNWNTSAIQDFSGLLDTTPLLNANVDNLVTAAATTIDAIFTDTLVADPDLSTWDTQNVVEAVNFALRADGLTGRGIEGWNTSKLADARNMFNNADLFDKDLSSWDVSSLQQAGNMFLNSGLSTTNYNLMLAAWSQQSLQSTVTFHGGNAKWKFGFGGQGRFDMISIYSWTITDGGQEDATMGCWLNTHNTLKTSANPSDGTGVTSWKDLSDNDNNADELTNPPVFKTNIANGEPMMLFDGADTTATIASHASINDLFSGGGSLTCAILPLSDGEGNLGRIFSQSGGNCYLDLGDESGGACKIRLVMTFSGSNGAWKTSNLDINIGEVNIIHVEYNSDDPANDPVFYINNSTTPVSLNEDSTPTGTASAANTITIGNAAISNRTFHGYMGDLGLFKSIPSSTIRQGRMSYLATKYGKTLS